jgi:hypothetical protein
MGKNQDPGSATLKYSFALLPECLFISEISAMSLLSDITGP